MALLPSSLRGLTPERLRDDVRLRAVGVGLGLIPPRTMHSPEDARILVEAARGARRVIEIGVYEGSSALVLLDALGPAAELHLVDPFGRRPDALPSGWGATEWATRRLIARRAARLGSAAPTVVWHPALSAEVGTDWAGGLDLVFIDGDHSEEGCAIDWRTWAPHVADGGHVVFHDARATQPGGRGLPGPTAVVDRELRGDATPTWEIVAEGDRTVAVRRLRATRS